MFGYGPSLSDQGFSPDDAHVGTCVRCGSMFCAGDFGHPDTPDPLTWDEGGAYCTDGAACARELLERACEIVEMGDQRLLASDGPAGNQPPDLSLSEWRELYVAISTAREALTLPPEPP